MWPNRSLKAGFSSGVQRSWAEGYKRINQLQELSISAFFFSVAGRSRSPKNKIFISLFHCWLAFILFWPSWLPSSLLRKALEHTLNKENKSTTITLKYILPSFFLLNSSKLSFYVKLVISLVIIKYELFFSVSFWLFLLKISLCLVMPFYK